MDLSSLSEIIVSAEKCIKHPEAFLSPQNDLAEKFKQHAKVLYDLAVQVLPDSKLTQALPELITYKFDDEQIWQQIELANNEIFKKCSVAKFLKTFGTETSLNDGLDENVRHSENADDKDEEAEVSDEEKDENSIENLGDEMNKRKEIIDDEKNSFVKKKRRKTEVDDTFFKLDELDEFLRKEDQKELNPNWKKNDDSDDEEGSIDLFNADLSESEGDGSNDEDGDGIKDIKFGDFFDNPESDNENYHMKESNKEDLNNEDEDMISDYENDEENEEIENEAENSEAQGIEKKMKKVSFNLLDDAEQSKSVESDGSEEDVEKTVQSTLEIRQERLQKKIKKLEAEAIAEKPWQVKGEASSRTRPPNSLLEEFLEFDAATRPAPIMTEQTTMKLEDVITQRIKDKAWDDVVKKFKPVETPLEYKKKLVMNQEKSKESLSQIYENEYVKQREALTAEDKDEREEAEPQEHIEIKERMHSLFRKLDALSNFHYTPKQAKPEIKIVTNVPAVSMEEVAPIATSEATLLAPEEIKAKQKGDVIGKSERTKTDMKRDRRKKKLRQHVRADHQSKQETTNGKTKKLVNTKTNKLKGRNIINTDESTNNIDSKAIKSSTAFFAHLQDQVVNTIKAKTKGQASKKNNKNTMSAIKLKL